MRYHYWTVQARPTPTSITTLGIGVIVEDPATGEIVHRFVEKPQTLLSRYSDSASAVARVIHDLERWLDSVSDAPARLELDERFVTTGVLDMMVQRWNNLITVNPKQCVSAGSIHAAVELLFSKLISYGEAAGKVQRVAQVRKKVRSAYESKEQLRGFIVPRPDVTIDVGLGSRFDLGVVRDGTILELNAAFSMRSSDFRVAANRVQAWTLEASGLRSSGATLELPEGGVMDVDRETPLVAVFWPPETKHECDLLSAMARLWKNLGISYIEMGDIEAHADELSLRVA